MGKSLGTNLCLHPSLVKYYITTRLVRTDAQVKLDQLKTNETAKQESVRLYFPLICAISMCEINIDDSFL